MEYHVDRMIRWVTIGTALATLSVTSLVLIHSVRNQAGSTRADYEIGAVVGDIPQSVFGAGQTVIVFARSTCGGCQAMKPVLGRLASMVHRQRGARIVLMSVGGVDEAELDFADEIGVRRTDVFAHSLLHGRPRVIPTFIVVDKERIVRHVHIGSKTDSTEMNEVSALLAQG